MSSSPRLTAGIAALAIVVVGCVQSNQGPPASPTQSIAMESPSPTSTPPRNRSFRPASKPARRHQLQCHRSPRLRRRPPWFLDQTPIFSSIVPSTSLGAVGQTQSYSASTGNNEFLVSVTMGSGDCQSGCINQHTWNYSVSYDGKVTLVSEQGEPSRARSISAPPIQRRSTFSSSRGQSALSSETRPIQTARRDRLANVPVVLRDPAGNEVASGTRRRRPELPRSPSQAAPTTSSQGRSEA